MGGVARFVGGLLWVLSRPLRRRRTARRAAAGSSAAQVSERMSGNLCRCGAHNGIVEAIAEVYAGADA